MKFPCVIGVVLAGVATFQAAAAAGFPTGLTGAWYEPATSGQGFSFDVLSPARLLVEFNGYTDRGERIGLYGETEAGETSVFGRSLTIRLYEAKGRGFTSFDPITIRRDWWGEAHMTLHDCSHASVTISGIDGTQFMNLIQLTRPAGLVCTE